MRKGLLNLGVFVLVIIILFFYPDGQWLATTYSFEFKSRSIYSFLTVLCLFSFYEYVRKSSFH
jgi:hypothetical protein